MKIGEYATPLEGKLKGLACKITGVQLKPMAFIIKAPDGSAVKFSNLNLRKSTKMEIRNARGGRI